MKDEPKLRLKLGDALWQKVLRPYLFGKEAEDAHIFTVHALKRMQELRLLWIIRLFYRSPHYQQPVKVFDTVWLNIVGIPAGFDKHAEIIPALDALGVGSVEVGTVVPEPQFGNERPRVFRYPEKKAVINRYGFNSVGAVRVAENIRRTHQQYTILIPIGISIGKNKETPDEKTVDDYLKAFEAVLPVLRPIDWVQINISSPNTPGLRLIFDNLDGFLEQFMAGAKRIMERYPHIRWCLHRRFVLKVSPDMDAAHIHKVVLCAARFGFKGLEGTNTTVNEEIKARYGLTEKGGLSGEPLRELSTQKLAEMAGPATEEKIDLVGVGGISKRLHALEKLHVPGYGAVKALQIYTGLVDRGPILIDEILRHPT